jgi:predicted phosphodiesterase
MTFTKLSAACKDAGSPFDKTAQDKFRVNTAGTHHPDRPQIRRILVTGNSCSVRSGITAPVAQKSQNLGVKIVLTHKTVLIRNDLMRVNIIKQ